MSGHVSARRLAARSSCRAWCLVAGLLACEPALAQDAVPGAQVEPTVTAEVLERRIAEVQAATDMEDQARTTLLELFRKALNYLGEADTYAARATGFQEALGSAQAEIQVVRDETAALRELDPLADLEVDDRSTPAAIEHALAAEEADLAAAETRRIDLEEQLVFQRSRPEAVGLDLEEARRRQEETAAALAAPAERSRNATLDQARGWVRETRSAALSAEIMSLDLERRSQPLRLRLLEAHRSREVVRIEALEARVAALGALANQRRRIAAEGAAAATAAAAGDSVGQHPLLVRITRENAALAAELNEQTGRLDGLERELSVAERLARRVAADHRDAEAAVEAGGNEDRLGSILLELRDRMPDLQVYRQRIRVHEEMIAAASVSRLQHQAESRQFADLDEALAACAKRVESGEFHGLREPLRGLLQQRQELLARALETGGLYQRLLVELTAMERELLDAAGSYNEFLNSRLIWLRSAEPTRLRNLANLPAEIRRLFAPASWSDTFQVVSAHLARSAVFWVAAVAVVGLVWKRRALLAALAKTSPRHLRPDRDNFGVTIRAVVLTLMVAAPLPLILAVTGWQARLAGGGTDLSYAVSSTLLYVALQLYLVEALRVMCCPDGLASAHFGWPAPAVVLLRTQLDRLVWTFILAVFVTRLAVDLNPAETGGTVARLGFLVYAAVVAFFFLRVFHPRRGVLAIWWASPEKPWLHRASPLLWLVLMAGPLTLAILALAGFVYSAGVLQGLLQKTVWMGTGLFVLIDLASRALLVTERRLAYQAALEKRQAEIAARRAELAQEGGEDDEGLHVEEPEVDLAALSDDSRELLKVTVVFAGLAALYALWSPVLPALSILDDVTLWHRTVTVEGEIQRIPITLASIVLTLIYGVATGVLARRLPALVEIALLRGGVSSGGRYTATTLTRYAIVAVGTWLVFNTLGARWSQFQWLVAALGVGIGFGLQEIVANFISGLIMLFERPLRVGDVVTVGETTGAVTRIQIRATTILDWDHKELVVPNREFITGRLLNWTLADRTVRLTIDVGVAYGTDVELALRLMREAAEENERVLKDPAPILSFDKFGDSALVISLRAYVTSVDVRLSTTTELNKAIDRKFAEAGIIIPFPQRHVHLQAHEPLRVNVDGKRDQGTGEVGS